MSQVRAGVVLFATVLVCWLFTTSAHTWGNGDTDVFDTNQRSFEQDPILDELDDTTLRTLIIRMFSDRIRSQLKLLNEVDFSSEPNRIYRPPEDWDYQKEMETRDNTDIIRSRRGRKCIGRFVPILSKCGR